MAEAEIWRVQDGGAHSWSLQQARTLTLWQLLRANDILLYWYKLNPTIVLRSGVDPHCPVTSI